MKVPNILYALCVSFLLIAFTACDSGASGVPSIEDTSVGNPDPGTEILPYTPPDWTNPAEKDPDNGDGEGENDGPGNGQQPVPEPSTLVLVGSGIALITLCRKKKKHQEDL
jgi:hypothetical protein